MAILIALLRHRERRGTWASCRRHTCWREITYLVKGIDRVVGIVVMSSGLEIRGSKKKEQKIHTKGFAVKWKLGKPWVVRGPCAPRKIALNPVRWAGPAPPFAGWRGRGGMAKRRHTQIPAQTLRYPPSTIQSTIFHKFPPTQPTITTLRGRTTDP